VPEEKCKGSFPEEKCKGSFRTVNSLKEAQDGSPSEDEGKK
jgi:hypothetical protein